MHQSIGIYVSHAWTFYFSNIRGGFVTKWRVYIECSDLGAQILAHSFALSLSHFAPLLLFRFSLSPTLKSKIRIDAWAGFSGAAAAIRYSTQFRWTPNLILNRWFIIARSLPREWCIIHGGITGWGGELEDGRGFVNPLSRYWFAGNNE